MKNLPNKMSDYQCALSVVAVPKGADGVNVEPIAPQKGVAMNEPMALMTIQEVAALLRYSTKTVYKKAAKGEIPSLPISRRKRLFSREAIYYWLSNRQVGNF